MYKSIQLFLICLFPLVLGAQGKTIHQFIFGHSLIDHRPPMIMTPSDETTVPHWVFLLAEQAGHEYAAGGQYGFLPQHQMTPPIAQWGYDLVPGVWDSDTEGFHDSKINQVMITAGNFIQYQPPSFPYYNDPGTTPISATESIIDFVDNKQVYIYENWPDMAGFIANESFPPSANELQNYQEYTRGEFHDWWLQYHNALLESRPSARIKMIPVGPVIADVIDEFLQNIEITELYEDNAPHGRANIYFLAGLVTYMSIYQEKAPIDFQIPNLIHPIVIDNYAVIVESIWQSLLDFNLPNGESRVFDGNISSTKASVSQKNIDLYPNPVSSALHLQGLETGSHVQIIDVNGQIQLNRVIDTNDLIEVNHLPPGAYFLQVMNSKQEVRLTSRFIKI